jgi:SAM-dependent methyltransferase
MSDFGPEFEEEEVEEAEPSTVIEYGQADYWENRYATAEGEFDWFFDWETLSSNIKSFYTGNDRVLIIGCGNSGMARDMLEAGFRVITSIDLSATVISQQKELHKDEPRLEWYAMNCATLTFPDNSFDLVIDKGTIDAIMCGDESEKIVNDTMSEAFRVLRNGGHFVSITFGSPGERFPEMRAVRRPWYVYPPIIIPPSDFIEGDVEDYIYIFEKREVNI